MFCLQYAIVTAICQIHSPDTQGRSVAEAERPGPQLQNTKDSINQWENMTLENVWNIKVELGLNIKLTTLRPWYRNQNLYFALRVTNPVTVTCTEVSC